MKKNVYILIILLLVLAAIIGFPFCFFEWNELLLNDKALLATYLVVKVVFFLLLLLACVWSLIKRRAKGNILQLIVVSALFQVVPLLVRASVFLPSFRLGLALIISIISAIAFIGYLGLLFFAESKQKEGERKNKGSEIEVVIQSECESRNRRE